jgi:hypothetical protein
MGGCALGLIGLERAQRIFFPGAPTLFGRWQGRTRHRESRPGGPGDWAALVSVNLEQALREDPQGLEVQLRKQLLEAQTAPQKVLLACLLADLAARRGDRSECRALIEEADEALRSAWEPYNQTFQSALSSILRLKSLFWLQEGCVERVFETLETAVLLNGKADWVSLIKAQAHLLSGETARCRAEIDTLLSPKEPAKRSSGSREQVRALLVRAESFLRDMDFDALSWILKSLDLAGPLSEEDLCVYARLRIESALHADDTQAAWRYAGLLRKPLRANPGHQGMARIFHLSCSRLHLAENNHEEAHRRLQLAENVALYPVARWEVDFLLGALLESEDREEEAMAIWERLAHEAGNIHFGKIAQARLARHPARSHSPDFAPEALVR